jgi:hypothetical protein
MPIVGSFAGASARAYGLGAGVALPGDFESIQTITAGSAVANIEFTSIPATYTHLQVRVSALTVNDQRFQINGDTASNYYAHYLYGDGATAYGSGTGAAGNGYYGYSGSASQPNVAILDLLDYANTNKFKTIRALAGTDANGSGYVFFSSTLWRSTSAITSLKFYLSTGNFAINTTIALYGVKT